MPTNDETEIARFKCREFRKGTLDFSLELIQFLQNDFFKQRFITLDATISGQDRIYPKTEVCITFLLGIYLKRRIFTVG